MQDTLRERNIVSPNKTELLWGAGCWALYLVGFSLLLSQLLPLFGFDLSSETGEGIFQIASFVLDFILIALVMRKFLWRSLAPLRQNGKRLLTTALFGLFAYYVLTYLMAVLIYNISLSLALTPENRNNDAVTSLLSRYPFAMVICVIFLAPATEECLVRGMIFAPLCRRSPWLAYLVTVVLFGALHVLPFIGQQEPILLLLSFLQYLPASLVLGWAYQRTRSILSSLALHSLINAISVVVTL